MNGLRASWLATACVLAVLSTASVARAQGFGPPGGGFGGPPGGGFGGPPGGFGGPPGGFGGPGGGETGSHLLTLSLDIAIWDEIKITDEQLGKLTRIKGGLSRQSRQAMDTLRKQRLEQDQQAAAATAGQPVDPEAARVARDAARQAMREAMTENNNLLKEDSEAALKKVLKPTQFSRVQAIDLQEAGPLVVARPDVVKALNLTSDQASQIQAVIAQYTQGQQQVDTNRREFFMSMAPGFNRNNGGGGPGGGGRPGGGAQQGGGGGGNTPTPPPTEEEQAARRAQIQATMEKMQSDSTGIKDKTIEKIGKILTKAQKTKFAGMQGKPFDLTLLNYGSGPNNPFTASLGGGGRGFGFGPGGGGPGGGGPGGGPPGATGAGTAAAPGTSKAAATGATDKAKGTTKKTATPK